MKSSRNRRVGLVFALVALVTAFGSMSVATAGASTAPGALGGRSSTRIVPAPLPSKKQLQQAATDRRDPFARSFAPSVAPAVALPSATWSPLGPAAIGPATLQGGGNYGTPNAGRVETPVVIPSGTHANRLVIATAGGGIFTSDDNGTTWTPRTDQAASLATEGIAVDASNPNHLIAGTGEAENSGDSYWGSGVLSSMDGGTTWTLQDPGNVFFGLSMVQVAIDPGNSNHMFAATNGGLFVTSDGGASWAIPTDASYASSVDSHVTAVVIDPSTPANVYVASTDNSTTAKVAKSTDGGATWALAQTGIPATAPCALIALTIAHSSPSTLYASVGSCTDPVAVYKTTNGATSWTHLTGTPDFTGQAYSYGGGTQHQGNYDNTIAVDPTNPNHVLAGGIAAVETIDGGATWTNTNGNDFNGPNHDHPDHHGLAFRPDGKVLVSDDGGIYLYAPSGTAAAGSISDLNGNLNDAQFFTGFNEVAGTVLAGTQDNASAQTSSATLSPWTALPGGDGGYAMITPNAPAERFITYPNQGLSITTDAFATTLTDITPPYGSAGRTPFTLAPNAATPTKPTVYFGADGLYRTTDPTVASPTWTNVTTSPLGASDPVSSVTVSPTNPSVVYVGYEDGTIQVSTNAGATWTNLPAQPFLDTYITGISVDPSNPKAIIASVSYNNTRTSPGIPHVAQFSYTSSVSAGSWTVISGNLPANAAVAHVIYDQGNLIAATDQGVYGTTTPSGASTNWSLVGTGLPNVQVQDVYADPSTNVLYAITHGRGAWKVAPAAVTIGPPTATITTPANGATYTQGQVVDASFTCAEGTNGPGLKPGTAGCSGTVANGAAINTSTLGPHTFSVTATSQDAQTATTTATYTVVAVTIGPPTATITTPANGATYTQGQVVNASYSCADATGGPGIATCTGPVPNGSPINTSTLGPHTFTVTATSKDGQTAKATSNYTVVAASKLADVKISITGPSHAANGTTFSEVVKTSNSGPAAATNVITALIVPKGVTVTSTGGGTQRDSVIYWTTSSIASGASVSYTVKLKVSATANGRVQIPVAAASTQVKDPNYYNNVASTTITFGPSTATTAAASHSRRNPLAIGQRILIRLEHRTLG